MTKNNPKDNSLELKYVAPSILMPYTGNPRVNDHAISGGERHALLSDHSRQSQHTSSGINTEELLSDNDCRR